jgi:hypothetical protein
MQAMEAEISSSENRMSPGSVALNQSMIGINL